jgi:glycosyltransferase involved in cell wall biosynthesis
MDQTALNAPEWEEFDGEFTDLFDAAGFLREHPEARAPVEVRRPAWDGESYRAAAARWARGDRVAHHRLLAPTPQLRHEVFRLHADFCTYYPWARELCAFDVHVAASVPIACYLSGQPYLAFSVGGDLQIDCGLANSTGEVMSSAFNSARFLLFTNPHTIGHCRRLGFGNGLYFPYLLDDLRYCPGSGRARPEWEARFGPGTYVLSSARLDTAVKGNANQLETLVRAVQARPSLHFIFLAWGLDAEQTQRTIAARGLGGRFHFLPPVGKRRLLDYYRSCDAVLDQFVYGYYGATGLEAAAVGKPVVMRIRPEQYGPLYRGDVAPVCQCDTADDLVQALLLLVDRPQARRERGEAMRRWLVRNHGRERMLPILLGLLRLAADRAPLPADLVSPLLEPLSEAERAYHKRCVRFAA